MPRNYWLAIGQFSQMLSSLLAFVLYYPWLFQFHHDNLWRFCGFAIAITGIVLIQTGLNTLGESFNYIHTSVKPTALVQEGIYRVIKHPIYWGNILVSIGIFVSAGTAWGLLGTGMVVINCLQAMREEEQSLCAQFPEYEMHFSA